MSEQVKQVNTAEFKHEVLESATPVIVDFWAPWCGPCRMMAPELDKVAGLLGGKARVVKVNVDENPSLASSYRVMGIPTLLVFHQGREVERHVGFIGAEPLARSVDNYLGAAAG